MRAAAGRRPRPKKRAPRGNPAAPELALPAELLAGCDSAQMLQAAFGVELLPSGRLRGFAFESQEQYEAVGTLVARLVQEAMVVVLGMLRLPLPDAPAPAHAATEVFLSENALACEQLLVLIHGSGGVRAGQWSRSLCVNEGLHTGSVLPYVERAHELGLGVLVLNPNVNYVDAAGQTFRHAREPPPGDAVLGHASPAEHVQTVFAQMVASAAASSVLVAAHSFGGTCVLRLLRSDPAWCRRIARVAMLDSAHKLPAAGGPGAPLPAPVRQFLRRRAHNWVRSEHPLGTPMPDKQGVRCSSAGHEEHEQVSAAAMEEVFRYLLSS